MKTFKRLLMIPLAGVFVVGLAVGCGGGSGKRIKFAASGEDVEYAALKALVNEYNETQGKEDGVEVKISYTASSQYENTVQQNTVAGANNAIDFFYVNDRMFKNFAGQGFLANLDELQEKTGITLETDAIYESGMLRYRYERENNTSDPDDPLYGVARAISPTLIYYNETAFKALNIICVSVPEEEITDAYVQQFNTEHNSPYFTKEHLKRGFVRSSAVLLANGNYDNDGYSWSTPQAGEVMVFNNRIAMSWDEVEDLGKCLTKSHNPNSPTDYGYYTWWWFYYGFSVGGDCIEDITGDGDWVFTLKDAVPNFIVRDDYVGTVRIGENDYAAGQIVSYRDRVTLDAAKKADMLANSSDLDETYLSQQVKDLAAAGDLLQLPSECDAFVRYVKLAQHNDRNAYPQNYDQYGDPLQISPNPANVPSTGQTGLFTGGTNAMVVEKSNSLLSIQDVISKAKGDKNFAWNVAPLPMYKIYNDDGTVKVHGVPGGASDSDAFCINANTTEEKQLSAMKFLKYLCSKEAQEYAAATGFTLPNRADAVQPYLESNPTKNLQIIAEAAFFQTPGDWWYMPDKTWIDENWAADLNNQVRNDRMTIDQFFAKFSISQAALNGYKAVLGK